MRNLKKFLVYAALYLVTFFIFYSLFVLTPYDDGQRLWWLRLIIVTCATILLAKYMFYMIVSPWYDVWVYWHYGDVRDQKYYPKVSVLVPAWNEEVGILTTVQSLLKSTYRNLELIIIDDGSTDNSDMILREFIRNYYVSLSSHHRFHHGDVSIIYKSQKITVREVP